MNNVKTVITENLDFQEEESEDALDAHMKDNPYEIYPKPPETNIQVINSDGLYPLQNNIIPSTPNLNNKESSPVKLPKI